MPRQFFYQPGHEVHTLNELNTKLNKTSVLIKSGMHFIAQWAYSNIVMPIKVCLLGYTVPLRTIVCVIIFSEKMS